MSGLELFFDGERIPRLRVAQIFRPPPGLPNRFSRSGLVVGTRGSGKTLLFRHLHEVHQGHSLHIDLREALSGIQHEFAIGSWGFDFSAEVTRLVAAKAAGRLLFYIAKRLANRELPLSIADLADFLPSSFTERHRSFSTAAEVDLAIMPPEQFLGRLGHTSLGLFCSRVGELCDNAGKPL